MGARRPRRPGDFTALVPNWFWLSEIAEADNKWPSFLAESFRATVAVTVAGGNLGVVLSRSWWVFVSVVAVLIAGCGGPDRESVGPVSPTAPDATSAESAGATTSAVPARPTSGIVVASEEDGVVEIGMIDLTDGSYAVENTFEIGDFAKGPNEPDVTTAVGFSMVVAPERDRVMAQKKVDGDFHTGWITADGDFVDVTAATMGERTDFSGPVSSFGVGFNRQGVFHYGRRTESGIEVWALPAGQTTGANLVTTVDLLTVYRFGYDGDLQFALGATCDDFAAYSWMGDWYLNSDGSQIYRGPRIPQAGPCGAEGQPLLPETNTAPVSDPVASPDLSEVAFIYTNADETRSIYVVAADGSGEPRKIDNVEWPSKEAHLVGWL